MSRSKEGGYCQHREAHGNQKIQYICLESSCLLNRLLCRKCVHQFHRKHKVGIIDKLIEPLNRLNMNSGFETSQEDFNYLDERLASICKEWEKLSEIFYNNMKELQSGILFQLETIQKTFTNDEIDIVYDTLMEGDPDVEVVNQYVSRLNFLNKDYLQDVDSVKKFADVIADRVRRTISKTVKKVDFLFTKMQEHIKQIDFSKYHQFKEMPEDVVDNSHNKSFEKQEEVKSKRQEDDRTMYKSRADDKRRKQAEEEQEELTNKRSFASRPQSHVFQKKNGLQRCK